VLLGSAGIALGVVRVPHSRTSARVDGTSRARTQVILYIVFVRFFAGVLVWAMIR
jgi:hypothetical protein